MYVSCAMMSFVLLKEVSEMPAYPVSYQHSNFSVDLIIVTMSTGGLKTTIQ